MKAIPLQESDSILTATVSRLMRLFVKWLEASGMRHSTIPQYFRLFYQPCLFSFPALLGSILPCFHRAFLLVACTRLYNPLYLSVGP